MVAKKQKIIWDEEARVYFKKAIAYIRKDSVQNAEKIKKDILTSIRALADVPERQHTLDKYRKNNDGSYTEVIVHTSCTSIEYLTLFPKRKSALYALGIPARSQKNTKR